jgi:hypothetical protein
MLVRMLLQCWLCREPFDLALNVLDGVHLGSPRFWRRNCTSRPQTFLRLVRKRAAEIQAAAVRFLDGEIALVQQILAREVAAAV